jgi:hypothetical protein
MDGMRVAGGVDDVPLLDGAVAGDGSQVVGAGELPVVQQGGLRDAIGILDLHQGQVP